MHAQYLPAPAAWVSDPVKPMIGGIVALDDYIRQQREKYSNVLLLDAGDISTGTPISKIEYKGALGGGFAEMLNYLGYDAMTIGNHEFDEGQDNLIKTMNILKADVLCANLFVNDRIFAEKSYKIFKKGSVRIGVIGLILNDLYQEVAKKYLTDIRVQDPVQTAQKIIDKIDPATDVIVLLTHQGIENDRELARQIKNADIIVGGHSHSMIEQPVQENGVLIVQANTKTRYLGRLTIDVSDDRISSFDYQLIPTWVSGVEKPRKELQRLVDHYKNEIDSRYNYVIGTLHTDWKRYERGESNIGNYIADVMRATTGTDLAVINSGGIRKDLSAGPVTKLDIVEILPFTNYLGTFECTGGQLLTLMQKNVQMLSDQNHGILQVSGLRMTYEKDKNGDIKIVDALIHEMPVDPAATYTGTTVDFILFGQALTFFGFEPAVTQKTDYLISDIVVDYIMKNPDINSKIEGRIAEILIK
jgi:2',3'-cyclic-nucleotide 2'-phosphodiesterase (5'-nucleotidase family)